ncbi:Crp/Fnr family transcriptional regulator [Listeria ilorinensis]|uniref:Crp/Fnr family transcriptional regulator n=1 Tax=Listeria ilorinensis TaxID=2867439 RepID=UPI001EF4EA16|nr:Crp/Fnr family transcriptional regulator [Listeria ilorinensis]
METLFSYEEFIVMMKKYDFPVKSEVISAKKKIFEENNDYVSLLVSGVAAGYLKNRPKEIFSIIGKGFFMGYSKVLDNNQEFIDYKTLSDCIIYSYRKEDIQYALSFSENYGFQYFIMKSVCSAMFDKAILLHQPLRHHLATVFKNIVEILAVEKVEHVYILPKEVTTSVIMGYSTLSRSSFYTQLLALREAGIIEKNNNCWCVDLDLINQLLAEENEHMKVALPT